MSHQAAEPQPRRLQRSFRVVAKPIGSSCNLNCTYCYYLHKNDLLSDEKSHLANDLLEEFIRQYIVGQDADTIFFSWHGGEPTLLGVDFFRKVIQLQQKYAGEKQIKNDLQTNGVLVDEVWCEFFKEHDFLVGLSIDGPKHLHDRFRVGKGGEPSFDRVFRAARLLQDHDVSFNTLTVINAVNSRHPSDVYCFLTEELGSKRLQWLPCVEPRDFRTTAPGQWDVSLMPTLGTAPTRPDHPASVVTDWSVDAEVWGEFLCQTFDLWIKNDLGKVFVNWFESLVGQWMQQPAQVCALSGACGRSLVVESDGSLYPCDHFVYPEYRLGTLRDKDCRLAHVVYSPRQRKFGCKKYEQLPNYCKQCLYRFACNGGCLKDRFLKTPDGEPGLNYLCPGTRRFLGYADPYLRQIAAQVQRSGAT